MTRCVIPSAALALARALARAATAAPSALAVSLALSLAAASPATAGEAAPDGRAIAERADKQNRPRDEHATFRLVILDRTGQRRERRVSCWFKAGKESDDDKSLVRFVDPPDVRGTALLTIENGEEEEQWLYLPDLRKTKRIAGASKSLSFAGTDFSNFDMRTEDLASHHYERTGEDEIGGRPCWIIEARPKDDAARDESGYSRRRIWVDKERYTVPRVEYYDKNGKLLKVSTTDDWEQVEGLWRANRVVMENVQEKTRTILTYERGRKINQGIDDSIFTKRALERP